MIIRYLKYSESRLRNFFKVIHLMISGGEIQKLSTIEIKGNIKILGTVIIEKNVQFQGENILSNGVKIGANCIIKNSIIKENTYIKPNTLIEGSEIDANSTIGPFSRIRPKTRIGSNTQIGNFVEIKNSNVSNNCKINHLTFIGDTEIGSSVIIGAGSVTCNFDGKENHQTTIGKNSFIGSGVFLVAPIKVGESSTIGTGSIVTEDTPAHKLTIARAKQITIDNWMGPKHQRNKSKDEE